MNSVCSSAAGEEFDAVLSGSLLQSVTPPPINALEAFPPASVILAIIASASALLTPSLTVFGAPSTRALASPSPRPVISRITLITGIFLAASNESRVTVNSVCSSAAGAAPAAGPAATATAAVTPNFSSIAFTSSEHSRTVMLEIASRI